MTVKRNTKQKKYVYDVIRHMDTHPTAAELFAELKRQGCEIGKSTVYRILADAVDEGLIDSVYSGSSEERFDGNTQPHYHIRCKACGSIYDSHLSFKPELTSLGIEADEEFEILEHHLEFCGICPNCR